MASFIAISILKQSKIPEQQFISFLNLFPHSSLRKYLSCANIFDGKRKRAKIDLIEMVVYGKITHRIKITESEFDKSKAIQVLNSFGETYQK